MQNLSHEQLKKLASEEGKKLAFLIHSLKCQERIKNAWLSLIPKLSIEQIKRLIDSLENEYLNEQTEEIDKFFKNELQKMEDEFEKKQEDIDNNAIKKVEDLINKVSK